MSLESARLLIALLEAYALAGALFAIPFLTIGLTRLDRATIGAPGALRLVILPGVIATWPALALVWMRERA